MISSAEKRLTPFSTRFPNLRCTFKTFYLPNVVNVPSSPCGIIDLDDSLLNEPPHPVQVVDASKKTPRQEDPDNELIAKLKKR